MSRKAPILCVSAAAVLLSCSTQVRAIPTYTPAEIADIELRWSDCTHFTAFPSGSHVGDADRIVNWLYSYQQSPSFALHYPVLLGYGYAEGGLPGSPITVATARRARITATTSYDDIRAAVLNILASPTTYSGVVSTCDLQHVTKICAGIMVKSEIDAWGMDVACDVEPPPTNFCKAQTSPLVFNLNGAPGQQLSGTANISAECMDPATKIAVSASVTGYAVPEGNVVPMTNGDSMTIDFCFLNGSCYGASTYFSAASFPISMQVGYMTPDAKSVPLSGVTRLSYY